MIPNPKDPADHEREDEKDNEVYPTVRRTPRTMAKPMRIATEMNGMSRCRVGIVQQPSGTNEHVESNENPKQYIRYPPLITHGCCSSFQTVAIGHQRLEPLLPAAQMARPTLTAVCRPSLSSSRTRRHRVVAV